MHDSTKVYQFAAANDLFLHLIDVEATKLLALVLSQAWGILLQKKWKHTRTEMQTQS